MLMDASGRSSRPPSSRWHSPWLIVLAAFLIRMAVMGFTYQLQLDPAQDHQAFGWETGRVARSIATGHGFSSPYPEPTGPTALIPPLYTYLVAGVFKIFGIYTLASGLVLLTLNNIFSALTCLPVLRIARKVFGPAVATRSAWAWALFPYSIALSNTVIWETSLTTLLFPILVLLTIQLERNSSTKVWAAYGLLWGIAGLASPATLSALPFLGGWIWLRQWRRGNNCTAAAVISAMLFLAIAGPWIWRCSRTYGRFVAFRGNFGMEVLVGNSDDTRAPANWSMLPNTNAAELDNIKRMGEPAYMAAKQKQAKELIQRQPTRYVLLSMRRVLNTWTGMWIFPPPLTFDEAGLPHVATYTLLSVLAFIGIGYAFWNQVAAAVPFTLILMFFPIVYYLTHSDLGFRHPIDPIIVVLAVYGFQSLRGKNTSDA